MFYSEAITWNQEETIFILVACSRPPLPRPPSVGTHRPALPRPLPSGHAWNIHSPWLCLPHVPSALRYRRADCSISVPYWEAWTVSPSDGCHWEIILVETRGERGTSIFWLNHADVEYEVNHVKGKRHNMINNRYFSEKIGKNKNAFQ